MFKTYIEITIGMSIIILLVLVLSRFLSNKYTSKWKYIVWLCVALRLLLPINYNNLGTLIDITSPETKIGISVSLDRNSNDNTYPISIYPITPNESISNVDENQSTQINSPSKEVEQEKNVSSINNEISIVDLLKNIWVIGIILFGMFYITNYLIFIFMIKKHLVKFDSLICDDVKKELNIHNKIGVFKCNLIDSPVLIGFFKPKILMPEIEYNDSELKLIFKHELTHYKRKDIWYKTVLVLANVIHWFNPFVYIMRRCADKDIEYTCDDIVTKDLNLDDKKNYSRVILKTMKKERS